MFLLVSYNIYIYTHTYQDHTKGKCANYNIEKPTYKECNCAKIQMPAYLFT